jgi:hypothetical protein
MILQVGLLGGVKPCQNACYEVRLLSMSFGTSSTGPTGGHFSHDFKRSATYIS